MTRQHFCFNCSTNLGEGDFDRYETCGAKECERAALECLRQEREEYEDARRDREVGP